MLPTGFFGLRTPEIGSATLFYYFCRKICDVLRRALSHLVMLTITSKYKPLCIYTKERIGRTSVGMLLKYQSFRRQYVVNKGCFTAG